MDYEINNDTLAVFQISKEVCKVVENENEYLFQNETFNVIEHSCEYFGSTYDGRYKGTKSIAGITHKPPIIIEESNKLIFFPTTSPRSENCMWISLNNILSYERGEDKNTSKITFKSGVVLNIPISIGSLTNQIFRASRLQVLLEERLKTSKNIVKYN